jgi:prevent-host-death family protein
MYREGELMSEIAVAEARRNFSDAVNRVIYGKERVILKRRGKGVAAIIPMEDLAAIEALEDQMDLEQAREILANVRDKLISWKKAKKQLGL